MNDTIKVILASIGSVIMILFIAFCIGMCSPSFRSKVYDVLDVVPEQQVESDKDNLSTQIQDYINQINAINIEKEELINKVAELNAMNETQADLLLEYQNRIDELNLKVIDLTNKLTKISNNVNGATLEYSGEFYNIFYPVFDSDDNYCYHSGLMDTRDWTNTHSGDIIIRDFNNMYKDFVSNMEKAVTSTYETYMICNDYYKLYLDGHLSNIEIQNRNLYFDNSCTFSLTVNFNNNQITFDDLINQLEINTMYDYQMHFEFGLNAENKIDNLICHLVVQSV